MQDTKPIYYSGYLGLDKILDAQFPVSASLSKSSHDEMLFIIVHQAFELWFKQIRFELASVIEYFQKDYIDDNREEMLRIVQRLQRIIKILKLINNQFEILETMTPLDFLDFRSLLTPASGFQSKQFRLIEIMLGLQMQKRYMPEHYKNTSTHRGGFTGEDYEEICRAEESFNLLKGLKNWLGRMPFLKDEYWNDYNPVYPANRIHRNKFLSDYFNIYQEMQKEVLDQNLRGENSKERKERIVNDYEKNASHFKQLFLESGTDIFKKDELSAALFIMLYSQFPLLRLPFELINSLIEIDELISMWRYKHYLMVKRMIGTKPGTGGSAGAVYLAGAIQTNNVFTELTLLPTYFIERDRLPWLPENVKAKLTF